METRPSADGKVTTHGVTVSDAKDFHRILQNRQDWIHRRVETIHLLHDGDTRRKVSVDLEVQDLFLGDLHVLPISVINKKVLKAFDVRSATGEALSVLTSEQTNQIEMAILRLGLAEDFKKNSDDLLRNIVAFDKTFETDRADFSAHHPAFPLLYDYYYKLDKSDVASAREMIKFAELFARGFLLIVHMPNSIAVGDRTILKFSYEEPLDLRVFFRPKKLDIYMVTDWSKSYHLEVRTPQPIAIRELSIQRIRSERRITPIRRRQTVDRSGKQIAHVTIGGAYSDDSYVAFCYLRADTRGIPRAASMATFVTFSGSLVLFTTLLPRMFDSLTSASSTNPGITSTSTTILILAPSLLFAFLAKRSDHHIEARILAGPRLALLVSGILMFTAAIATAHPRTSTNWHFQVPSDLPKISGAVLLVYWIWYFAATNSLKKNGDLARLLGRQVLSGIRSIWQKIRHPILLVFKPIASYLGLI